MSKIVDTALAKAYEKGYADAERHIAGFLKQRAAEQLQRPTGARTGTVRAIIALQLEGAAEDIYSGDYIEVPWQEH